MNAKQILSLCEMEKLDYRSVANSVEQYFLKKFKSIGLDTMVRSEDEPWAWFHTASVNDINLFKRASKDYIYSLSRMIKSSNVLYDKKESVGTIFIPVKDVGDPFYPPTLRISCRKGISLNSSEHFLVVSVGWGAEGLKYIWSDEFPVSEEWVQKIYSAIDSVAKAVRLVSFGE